MSNLNFPLKDFLFSFGKGKSSLKQVSSNTFIVLYSQNSNKWNYLTDEEILILTSLEKK